MKPGELPKGTEVGAYTSIGDGLKVFRRNHPTDTLSQHPLFYNAELGILDEDSIEINEMNPLSIGNDVWIGSSVIILATCKSIGDGAIVAAGSIVTKDVAPYSIVAGIPAKCVRKRYSEDLIHKIKQSSWWDSSVVEIYQSGVNPFKPLSIDDLSYFINNRKLSNSNGK